MKPTTLGRSGLEVSRIAFGTWQLGGDWGRFDEAKAVAAIRRGDFVPGFSLRHATKDAELALTAAQRHGVELPLTSALLPRWYEAIAADHGDDDVASAVTAASAAASPPDDRPKVFAT